MDRSKAPDMTLRGSLLSAVVFTLAVTVNCVAAPSDDERLNEFFESVFQRDLARSPIRASRLGIKTHQDKWDEIGEQRAIENAELARQDLTTLRSFDYAALTPAARLSYRLFERGATERLKGFYWRRLDYHVTQMGGLHRTVATTLLNSHPIDSQSDADAYIARLDGVKPLLERLVTELKRQEDAGVRPPRFVYALTIGESQNLVTGRPFDNSGRDSPILADFRTKVAKLSLSDPDEGQLIVRAEKALSQGFGPGYQQLIAHLRRAERGAAAEGGAGKLPNGAAFYRYLLEVYTTLPLTPDELHQLGLNEVARIHAEMREVGTKMGFTGSLPELFQHVRNDAQFYYPDTAEGREQSLADARTMLEQVRARQREILGIIPKADVVIRPVEAWRERSAAKAFYQGPPQDGSRPGIFYLNLYDMRAAPKYQLPAVLYHEAIPGHHVETVIAHELGELPKFRRFSGIAAFSEGWGLYSELLAKEMGLYATPADDFGRLSLALMRAARLVVDTGIHAKDWTRERAIAYLDENMPSTHYDNRREIERYIVLPGQATSYAVGMLKILELRERAQRELGARFDLRGFHDVVLGNGPLPLPLVEEHVTAWIASKR